MGVGVWDLGFGVWGSPSPPPPTRFPPLDLQQIPRMQFRVGGSMIQTTRLPRLLPEQDARTRSPVLGPRDILYPKP